MDPPYPKGPVCTRVSLASDLRSLGIRPGTTLLLHSSLRSLGWVCGSAEAVVLALLDVLGPDGTLVVPTQTSDNSDPSLWQAPPVPEEWWPVIREHTPAYDPRTSRTRLMGAIAEAVRTWPGVARSAHPQTSFAAVGPRAGEITAGHALDCRVGERSPLGRLEEVEGGAHVLLLGVGFDVCTAFHLAEYRVPEPKMGENAFAVMSGGRREWMTVRDVESDDEKFEEIGKAFVRNCGLEQGSVGGAKTWLFDFGSAVKYAEEWFSRSGT